MRHSIGLMVGALALASPVGAQSTIEASFAGALRGCEEWVLNPASWTDGVGPFISAVGLGNQMSLVDRVDEISLPPKELRRGNHYWRINTSQAVGFVLVVSDQLPMCHITGGGDADLQPAIEAIIASETFAKRWQQVSTSPQNDLLTSLFRNLEDPSLSVVISRASKPKQRLDRVQVLATATYATTN